MIGQYSCVVNKTGARLLLSSATRIGTINLLAACLNDLINVRKYRKNVKSFLRTQAVHIIIACNNITHSISAKLLCRMSLRADKAHILTMLALYMDFFLLLIYSSFSADRFSDCIIGHILRSIVRLI